MKTKVIYHVHSNLLLDFILTQLNSVHTVASENFGKVFIIPQFYRPYTVIPKVIKLICIQLQVYKSIFLAFLARKCFNVR